MLLRWSSIAKPILTSLALATTLSTIFIFAQLPTAGAGESEAAIMPLPFARYNTAGDVPASHFKKNKVIRGRVVKVIDGDTIRIRHTPFYPLSKKGDYSGLLSQNTVSVRFYGVDAPETAHFGNKAQPYAHEAKDWVASKVDGKVVRVKLLRKDQYSRAVGKVTVGNNILPFLRTDLTKGLADRGYATLYTGGGAEYDNKREVLEKKIKRAQKKKKGIWSNGVGNHVDPAAYKRAIKAKKNGNGKGGAGRAKGKEKGSGKSVPASVY